MKILYAIQGTGNGHLARATELVPLLNEIAQTDILISGIQCDLHLPFKVDYQKYGASFIFGKKGGVNIFKTIFKQRPLRFFFDVLTLPVNEYDLVLCDYEPISAWSCLFFGVPCIGISHQNAVLHPLSPKPNKNDRLGKFVLKYYAPVSHKFGFHFNALDNDCFNPVIRKEIRNAIPVNNSHYTVYLPAYSNNEIENILSSFQQIEWEVFSKHCKEPGRKNNILFRPVSSTDFTKSFISCAGILCTAGFETPAEALFMGKKLCVIPMKNQYEQWCNAAFLAKMGITVLTNLKEQENELGEWIKSGVGLKINYPDESKNLLNRIITHQQYENAAFAFYKGHVIDKLRPLQIKMISLKSQIHKIGSHR